MKKRLTAILLVACMVITWLPGYVSADDTAISVAPTAEEVNSPEENIVIEGETTPASTLLSDSGNDGIPVIEADTETLAEIMAGGEYAYFQYTPAYTESYTFYSTGSYDTYGYLYDSDMSQLAYNDDGGENSNYSLTYTLEAGVTYILAARFYSSSKTGSFDVMLQTNHSGEGVVTNSNSCTEDGLMTYTCSVCGEAYTEIIPAAGHTWEGEVTTPNSCTEEGLMTYTCSVCKATYTEPIPSSHTWNDDRVCSVCGESFYESGTCGDDLTWSLDHLGLLTISGTGAMTEYSSDSEAPWYEYHEMITELLVDEEVTSLSRYGFRYFEKLEAIYYNATAMDDLSRDSDIFYRTGGDSPDVTVVIGANVTRIPAYLFYNSGGTPDWDASWNCNGVTAVIFEEGSKCETIGNGAFSHCYSLNSITIPESVTSIGNYVFYNCKNLLIQIEASELPEALGSYWDHGAAICMNVVKFGVTEYGQDYWITDDNTAHVWKYHGDDTTVIIPETIEGVPVVEIATSAFATIIRPQLDPNGKITYVEIPNSVTTINSFAFNSCVGLEEIVIPESIEYIGESAFYYCKNVTEIRFNAIAMDNLESDSNVFSRVGENIDGITVTIGSKVTTIPDYLFCASNKDDAPNLTEVKFEEGSMCARIGADAFLWCDTLAEITIPENVKSIVEDTFYGCTGLTTIYFNATDMNDVTYPFGNTGSGSGALVVYIGENVGRIPSNLFRSSGVTQVVFADNNQCTNIGSSAFYGCAYLTEFVIPANITTMGSGVFGECIALTAAGPYNSGCSIEYGWSNAIPAWAFSGSCLSEIVFPDNITSIERAAFQSCVNLQYIEIPEGVTVIGDYAFNNCISAETIIIPDGVTSIGESAFMQCRNVKSIIVPDSVQSIGNEAFRACSNLETISISNNITEIDGFTFKECSSLLNVEIPYGVTAIHNSYAFGDCTSLKSVTIPSTVNVIGYDTFSNCPELSNVYYGGSEEQWKQITIYSGNDPIKGENAEEPTATIHFSSNSESGGTEGGGENGPGNDNSGSNKTSTYVRYLSEWDAEEQIVYFGMFDLTGSQITEETDRSCLADIEAMIGKYVLAETKPRDDEMVAPDTLINIYLVETRTGTVSSADNITMVIDGVSYNTPENTSFPSVYANSLVMYHLYDGALVGIELIKDYSDEGSGDSGPSYPEFDYGAEQEEPSNEEGLLEIYAEDWLKKYNSLIEAVKKTLNEKATTEDAHRAAAIHAEASRMQREDNGSTSKYLTFVSDYPSAYKKEAYIALATLLYDNAADDFDFSSVDFGEEAQGASMVNAVTRSIVGSSEKYIFDNITIQISIFQAGSANTGSLTCTINNKNRDYTAIVCSNKEAIADTITSFYNELKEMGAESAHNVYTAITTDLICEPLSTLTDTYITQHVGEIESKFAITLRDEFYELGVGELIDTLHESHHYLVNMINPVQVGNNSVFEECLKNVETVNFEDAEARGTVKKRLKALNKATNKLNNAVTDYLNGELVVSDFELFWKSTFNCPVNVAVYNSDGIQIGYVGEDDIWYEDNIVIEEDDGSKTVYSLTDEMLSFEITGTAYGTMSCSFEEYDENNNPVGRLNYYDVALEPDQNFTVETTADLLANSKLMAIKTENKSILANEYISVSESASVLISCTTEADDGNKGGTISGSGTHVRGDAVVLLAIPDDGYTFVGWFLGDSLVCVNEVFEFTATEDVTLTAVFFYTSYIYVDAVAQNGGSVTGTAKYKQGETATIIATPDECYAFDGWYVNDELVSTEAQYQFLPTEDSIYVAHFSLDSHSTDIPAFTWSDDFTTCTASFVCKLCGDVQTIECVVTSETTSTDEFEHGIIIYTAAVDFNGQTYTDTRTVEISAPEYIPGDINDDGNVNARDVTKLLQYLADWDVEVAEAALDINGDGNVNVRDVTLLKQYIAGWDVELF